jgi:hypothetical protein
VPAIGVKVVGTSVIDVKTAAVTVAFTLVAPDDHDRNSAETS